MALFENNQLLSNFGNLFKGKSVDIPTGKELKGSPWNALFGEYGLFSNPTGAWDKFKNGNTNEVNQNIASQNLAFQRENLEYEKALQQKIFEREDTSYQRTVNDMRMAGLNPLSMQGTNGAGEAIQTEAMHNDYQHSDSSNLQAISQIFDVINQVSNTRNNASLQQSQANLINAQAENQRIKNLFENDLLSQTLESNNLKNIGQKFANERSNIAWLNEQANLDFNTMYGLTDNMPDLVKMTSLMTGNKVFNRDFIDYKKRIDNYGLGKGYSTYGKSSESNFLSSQQLSGALVENQLINGLLSLIPMGIGSLFRK